MLLRCVLPISAMCLAAAPALAVQRHVELAFTASNFASIYSGPDFTALPQSVISGQVIFDYDTATVQGGDRFAPTSVNLMINGYSYTPATVLVQTGDDFLGLYGSSTVQGQLLGTDIFYLSLSNFYSGSPDVPGYFSYSVAESNLFANLFVSQTVGYTRQFADAGAVPEPASWLLMIAGFGLAGVASRRRQTMLPA